jgi:hypothetical protein
VEATPGRLQLILRGTTASLLLVAWSSFALASSGIETDSKEVSEEPPTPALPSPSLNVDVADHAHIDATAGMGTAAGSPSDEEVARPVLVEDVEADATSDEETAVPVSDPPETALRLPGVAEEDQPRFRRQMYRTDI